MSEPKQRQAADIIAVIAGLSALGIAMWAVPLFGDRSDQAGDYKWSLYLLGGSLALLAVYLTTKQQSLARWVLRAAGVVMLVAPFISGRTEGVQIVSSVVIGLAMLGSSLFFGDLARVAPPRRR